MRHRFPLRMSHDGEDVDPRSVDGKLGLRLRLLQPLFASLLLALHPRHAQCAVGARGLDEAAPVGGLVVLRLSSANAAKGELPFPAGSGVVRTTP